MNSAQLETKRRQRIIEDLFSRFDVELFEGVLLQGSMVYGRDHCVTADSDIDLLFVLSSENLDSILEFDLFSCGYVNEVARELFVSQRSDCMWTDHMIDDVVLNMGIIRSDFFNCWSQLRSWEIRRCRMDRPGRFRIGVNNVGVRTASNADVEVPVFVSEIGNRYLVTEPLYHGDILLEQQLYGSFLLSEALFDKGHVQHGVEQLLSHLLSSYGPTFVLRLVSYGLSKSSVEFREDFHRRIGYVA
jgi:hypothetical protein